MRPIPPLPFPPLRGVVPTLREPGRRRLVAPQCDAGRNNFRRMHLSIARYARLLVSAICRSSWHV
jgi:hypothetical protein